MRRGIVLVFIFQLLSSAAWAQPLSKLRFVVRRGTVAAVDTQSGKTKWSKPTGIPGLGDTEAKAVVGIQREGPDLFITTSHAVLVYDARNGKEKWRVQSDGGLKQKAVVTKEAILMTYWASGAYLHQRTTAYARSSGKRLWDLVGGLKTVVGSQAVLVTRFPVPDPKPHDRIISEVVDIPTGKVISQTEKP